MCKKLSPIRPTKHFPRLQVLKRWNRRKAQEGATLPFDSLNDDIFADIMLFAGTASVSSMAKTSKEMSLRCDSQQVWKKLCVATGKVRLLLKQLIDTNHLLSGRKELMSALKIGTSTTERIPWCRGTFRRYQWR